MKKNLTIQFIALLVTFIAITACQGQSTEKKMKVESKKINPLICDIETGICETPVLQGTDTSQNNTPHKGEKLKMLYFTDPICSSCWGIEPQLRKLKLEYGAQLDIVYVMGGLLPDWNYNSGGISKPSDVAHHWDEVSIHYDMPIDGDIWLEDPLSSSYPPSIAFKAAQLQSKDVAVLFMREMREMMFLHKKNLAKWEYIATAAKAVGLNVEQLKTDIDGQAKTLFEADLKLAQSYGVRGFPTIYFIDTKGNKEMVYGSKPYALYEAAILTLNPACSKSEYSKNWETLFAAYPTLTAKEYSILSGMPRVESEVFLNTLSDKGTLEKWTTKNGSIWMLKK